LNGIFSANKRLHLESVLAVEAHAIDILDTLCRADCRSTDDFEWVKQIKYDKCYTFSVVVILCILRFSWDTVQDTCVINVMTSVTVYGFEYMGCVSRLVMTPEVENCCMCCYHENDMVVTSQI